MSDFFIFGDLPDKLRTEGILCKGYGILPKFVMLDTDLTIEAKTIYTYFCSFAGAGETAFPSRDKILMELPMSKDSYYKHFTLLTNNGYIETTQQKSGNNIFSKNIYTLMSNPKKFKEAPPDPKHNQVYARIRYGGLKSVGYGMIPKAVMQDSRLALKAKGIYAYFCAFTGSGNNACPKKEKILYHLQITHNTYQKFYKQLIKLNYITAVQRHIDGRMSVNDYFLNDTPNMDNVASRGIPVALIQDTKIQDTKIQDTKKQDTKIQDTKIQDTKIQDTKIQDTKIQDTEKQDTNNNSTNINNPIINQSINQQSAKPVLKERMSENNNTNINNPIINQSINQQSAKPVLKERMSEDDFKEIIFNELWEEENLPYHFLANDRKLEMAIKIITNWDTHSKETNYQNGIGGIQLSSYITFVEALIEMLSVSERPMQLKGSFVTYAKVYDRVVNYIEKSTYSEQAIYFKDFQETAINDFIKASKAYRIQNHLQYMKSCIWTALQTASVSVDAAIAHDFS